MNLLQLGERYLASRDVSIKYGQSVAATAKSLSRSGLKSAARFSATFLNRWLKGQLEDWEPHTVRTKRTIAIALWRHANELGKAPPLRRVMTIAVPDIVPIAFLQEEIAAMISIADRLTGRHAKTKDDRRLWWLSHLHAYYDSGLRLGDLLDIERPDIWPSGRLAIVQNKTGHSHTVQFRPETIQLIDSLLGRRKTGLVWPLWGERRVYYEAFKAIRRAAGIPDGTSKWLRRSSASYVEAVQPGRGPSHLGHKTPWMFQKFYCDPRIVSREPTLPPALPLTG